MTSRNGSRITALGPSQLLARSNSSIQCGVRKVQRLQAQLANRRRGDQLLRVILSLLQITDSVQGWSDAVGVHFGSSWAIYVCRAPGRLRSSGERCAQATTTIQKSQVRSPRSSPAAAGWLCVGNVGAIGVGGDLLFALRLALRARITGCSRRLS